MPNSETVEELITCPNKVDQIESVIRGPIIIIDDAFGETRPNDKIVDIKKRLESEGFIVAAYSHLPSCHLHLYEASFVIIDWNMRSDFISDLGDADLSGVRLGSELLEEEHKDVLLFIEKLLKEHPAPVFVFTNEPIDKVKDAIEDHFADSEKKDALLKLIDVKAKYDMDATPDSLFSFIHNWFDQNPAAYLMAAWRGAVVACANGLFKRLYDVSSNWPTVIWTSLLNDISMDGDETGQTHDEWSERVAANELGSFLTRVLANSLRDYGFSNSQLKRELKEREPPEVIRNVIEQERYIKLDGESHFDEACHCGDLFLVCPDEGASGNQKKKARKKLEDELNFHHGDILDYLLVISAECDLARDQNPLVAVVTGQEVEVPQNNDIVLSFDDQNELFKICVYGENRPINSEKIDDINTWIGKTVKKNPCVGFGGDLLRRHDETIIPCVAGKRAIAFKHKIMMCRYDDIKRMRIGRLLPPYITKVQRGASDHLIRVGLEPVPEDAFR